MKIALVAHHARPTGGQDRYLLELARQLSQRHEVHLVVIRAEGTDGSAITVREVGLRDLPILILSPLFERRARTIVQEGGYDIVHGIGGSLPGANVVTTQYCHLAWLEALKRYDVREGSVFSQYSQVCASAQAIGYEKRAYASRQMREVIAVSHQTADDVRRFHHVPAERVTVIHNGSDPALFDRSRHPGASAALRGELQLKPDALVALLVGTYARKGLDTAIAAVAKASRDLHLVVAGSGDIELAHHWAEEAGMESRLHLLGPRRDVAELYAASDLFILPTRYEPFGMVIAEAMQSSLPVVVSRCAGAADLIVHGESGFVVDAANDVDGFTAHLRTLVGDPARRAAVGQAARIAALSVEWPRVAEQTEAVYRRAMASR